MTKYKKDALWIFTNEDISKAHLLFLLLLSASQCSLMPGQWNRLYSLYG